MIEQKMGANPLDAIAAKVMRRAYRRRLRRRLFTGAPAVLAVAMIAILLTRPQHQTVRVTTVPPAAPAPPGIATTPAGGTDRSGSAGSGFRGATTGVTRAPPGETASSLAPLFGAPQEGSQGGAEGAPQSPVKAGSGASPTAPPRVGLVVFTRAVGSQAGSPAAELMEMQGNGSGVRPFLSDPLADADKDPSWSPTGQQLVFASQRGNPLRGIHSAWSLYIAGAAGSPVRSLTTTVGGESDDFPAWSPNGSLIAFSSVNSGAFSGIDVIAPNGTGRRVLAAGGGFAPQWSPNGRFLSFLTGAPGGFAAWIIGADGNGLRELATATGIGALLPSWSPDGSWLILSRGSTNTSPQVVELIHPDGTGLHVLDQANITEVTAAWTLDGRYLLLSRRPSTGPASLCLVSLDGEFVRTLETTPAGDIDGPTALDPAG